MMCECCVVNDVDTWDSFEVRGQVVWEDFLIQARI